MLQTSEWALSEWKETAAVGRKGMDEGGKKKYLDTVCGKAQWKTERERETRTHTKEKSSFD